MAAPSKTELKYFLWNYATNGQFRARILREGKDDNHSLREYLSTFVKTFPYLQDQVNSISQSRDSNLLYTRDPLITLCNDIFSNPENLDLLNDKQIEQIQEVEAKKEEENQEAEEKKKEEKKETKKIGGAWKKPEEVKKTEEVKAEQPARPAEAPIKISAPQPTIPQTPQSFRERFLTTFQGSSGVKRPLRRAGARFVPATSAIVVEPKAEAKVNYPLFLREVGNFFKPVVLNALSKAKIQGRKILQNPAVAVPLVSGTLTGGIVYFASGGNLQYATLAAVAGALAPAGASEVFNRGGGSGGSPPSFGGRRGGANIPGNLIQNGLAGRVGGLTRLRTAALLANPWVWGTIAVVVILLLLVLIFPMIQRGTALCPPFLPNCGAPDKTATVSASIDILKDGPKKVPNGEDIQYTLLVTNRGSSATNVSVKDKVPGNTTYKSSDGEFNEAQNQVSWTVSGLASGAKKLLNLIVTPTKEDVWVVNQAEGTSAGGSVPEPGNIPPTQDNCSGTYRLGNPLGNFGDPACSFDKDKLYALLKQSDPVDADFWFLTVVRLESTYNPNAFNGSSTSGQGAYGLFQMNPSGRGNGQYDRGDVEWQLQTTNAVNYNKLIAGLGLKWCYWEAAHERWGKCR